MNYLHYLKVGDNLKTILKKLILKIDKEVIRKFILVISALIFLYSSYMLASYYFDAYRNWRLYRNVNRMVLDSEQQQNQRFYSDDNFEHMLRKVVLNEQIERDNYNVAEILPRFKPLLEQNEDTIGWIKVPNTKWIDYPVVKYKDNELYLKHGFDRSRQRAGAIFMDFRNTGDATDRHTIIYGHHMQNGTMFKGLLKYEDREFFEENRLIYFSTLYEELEWEVFAAYVTGIEFNYIRTRFNTPDEYIGFLNSLQSRSLYETDIKLSADDKILTLSTCTYDYSDARFVVHARLIQ